jgi:hypothetical protein
VRGVSRSTGSATKIEGRGRGDLGWSVAVELQPWKDEAGVVHSSALTLAVYCETAELQKTARQLPPPGKVIELLVDEPTRPPFAAPDEVLGWQELGYRRMQLREVDDAELGTAALAASRPFHDPALGQLVPHERRPRSYRTRRPAGYELVVPAPDGPPQGSMLARARKEVALVERDPFALARVAVSRVSTFRGQALRAEQLELQTLRVADDESGATAYFSFGLARSLLEVSLRDGHVQAAQVVD